MSEVQYIVFSPLFLSLSFFLFIPSTRSLAASSKHWHACQLEKCHLFPFWQGPWLSRWHVDVKHQCIYCHALPWWQKSNIWTHSFCWSKTGNVSWVFVHLWKYHQVVRFEGRHLAPIATAFIYCSSPVTSTSCTAKAKLHSWVSSNMRPYILYSPPDGCWSEIWNLDRVINNWWQEQLVN